MVLSFLYSVGSATCDSFLGDSYCNLNFLSVPSFTKLCKTFFAPDSVLHCDTVYECGPVEAAADSCQFYGGVLFDKRESLTKCSTAII